MPTDPELHITVVALSGGGVEMTDEIALSKAALLYADRVTLASPKAVLVAGFATYLTASPAERRDALLEMAAGLPGMAEAAAMFNAIKAKRHRSGAEIIAMRRLEQQMEQPVASMAAKIDEMLDQANARELDRAMQAGVIDLDTLGVDTVAEPYSTDNLTKAMTELIGHVLSPGASTYPMFSEITGGLARSMVNEGKIAGAELAPATQVGIAGRFISALDAFPDAPMDVVLDARRKLRGPLRRFRAGVTRLSRELSASGIDALDPRFEQASADLYHEHVAPALEEIEQLSREMGLRNALLRSAPKSARDVAVATMALIATTGGGVEELAKLAVPAVADLVGRATIQQRELREQREKNEFAFLYEAEKRLS